MGVSTTHPILSMWILIYSFDTYHVWAACGLSKLLEIRVPQKLAKLGWGRSINCQGWKGEENRSKLCSLGGRAVGVPLDCEQSLFFFRFSESKREWEQCTSAGVAKPRDARNVSHARGHLRVSRFARRTTEKRETARSLVFPLFIGYICSVIVVFCRCLCTCLWSLCWRRCLRCAKRCSLCFAHGFLLSSSSPLAMNLSWRSPEEFRLKIEDFQPLVVLVVLCHLNGKLLVIHRL